MSKNKDLIKGTFIYSISNVLIKAGAIFILPIVTRLLTTDEYGALGILNTLRAIIPIIMGCGLYIPQMRHYAFYKDLDEEIGSYIFTVNIFLFIINFILFMVILTPFGSNTFIKFINLEGIIDRKVIIIVIFISILSVFITMSETIIRMQKKYFLTSISSVISFLISNLFSIYLIYKLDMGLFGYFLGAGLGLIFILIMYYPRYIKNAKPKLNKKYLKESVVQGQGMVLTELIDSIIDFSDRFILLKFLNLTIVGYYTLAYTMCKALGVITSAFSNSWVPIFYERIVENENDEYIKNSLYSFFSLLVFFVICGQLFSKSVIIFLFTKDYSLAQQFIPILLPAISLQIFYNLDMYFHYKKETHIITMINIVPMITNIVINVIFIPIFGPVTAAWSTLLSFLARTSLSLLFIRNRYKIKYNYIGIGITLLLCINPIILYLANCNFSVINFLFKIVYLIFVMIFMFKFTINKEIKGKIYNKLNKLKGVK